MSLMPEIRDTILRHYRAMGTVTEVSIVRRCPVHLSSHGFGYYLVVCPCGAVDHYGYLPEVEEGLGTAPGPIISCLPQRLQFWYRPPSTAADVVLDEESRFLEIMRSAGPRIERERRKRPDLSVAEFSKYMHETHGVPPDVTEDFLS